MDMLRIREGLEKAIEVENYLSQLQDDFEDGDILTEEVLEIECARSAVAFLQDGWTGAYEISRALGLYGDYQQDTNMWLMNYVDWYDLCIQRIDQERAKLESEEEE